MGDFNHGHIQWKSLESTGLKRKCVTFVDLLCFGSHDVSHSYSCEWQFLGN